MTSAQFDDWARHSARSFAGQQVAAGLQPAPEAEAYAARQIVALLPAGLGTPQHSIWHVVSADEVVGSLWLRVRPLSTEVEAYVFDVEVIPEARGRGLGRATMLAAEHAARELGADVVRLNVFGHNLPAIRLYESLGHRAATVAMTKRLSGHPARDPGGSLAGSPVLRDMTAAEYVGFRSRLEVQHAADLVRAGAMPAQEARRQVADDLAALLPRGRLSAGNRLWTGHPDRPDSDDVAGVWLHLQERSDGTYAFAHALEDARLLAAVERECRALGVSSLGLSVPGFDTARRSIYERAGFELTALTMTKEL
jgi:ribosomal protein S18 acetylase RimI-like enzyme